GGKALTTGLPRRNPEPTVAKPVKPQGAEHQQGAPRPEPTSPPDAGTERRGSALEEFRWEAFFQRAREPLFLLNRRCRLLFVNEAWERLTGMLCPAARGLSCPPSRPSRHPDPSA